MTRRFASNHFVICYGVLKETITPMAWKHFCCTMLNVNPLEKGTTLTALIHTFHDTINFIQQLDLMVHDMEIYNPYGVDSYIPQYNLLVF